VFMANPLTRLVCHWWAASMGMCCPWFNFYPWSRFGEDIDSQVVRVGLSELPWPAAAVAAAAPQRDLSLLCLEEIQRLSQP
jgi:hypothetical protein